MAEDFFDDRKDEWAAGDAFRPAVPDFSSAAESYGPDLAAADGPDDDFMAAFDDDDDDHHTPSPFDLAEGEGEGRAETGGFFAQSADVDDFNQGFIPTPDFSPSQAAPPPPSLQMETPDEYPAPSAALTHIFDSPPALGSGSETAEELAAKEAALMDEISGQMSWYSKKCRLYKKADTATQLMMLLIAGSIPVITAIDFESNRYVILFVSAFLTFLEGVRNLVKYKEKWFIYRDTLETLKKEKLMYNIGVGPYETPGRLKVLGLRYIEAVSSENQIWRQEMSRPDQDK